MTERDDRVLPLTRAVAAGIVPVLMAAFVILYLFPTRTRQLWAWTIDPTMSAMIMGGGYLAGAYFFARTARVKEWHRVGVGFLGTTVFTTLLLVTTVLHWDRFNHDHVSFWAWLALYAITPPLLPLLWLRNRRFDPQAPAPDDPLVPSALRAAMAGFGGAQLGVAILMFVRPSLFVDEWPWALTPTTARSLSAFLAFPAVTWLGMAIDRRWSSFEIAVETSIFGLALVGIGAIRAAGEFRGGDATVWGWRVALAIILLFLITVRLAMGRRARREGQPGRVTPAGSPATGG